MLSSACQVLPSQDAQYNQHMQMQGGLSSKPVNKCLACCGAHSQAVTQLLSQLSSEVTAVIEHLVILLAHCHLHFEQCTRN